jgi:hypothetical protein
VITIDDPGWRARGQRFLRPVQTQTPGVHAWLLEKEGAAILLADLRRRADFREHNSPQLLVNNGQFTAISAHRGRSYVRSLIPHPELYLGYQPESAVIDEGFTLEFSPLLSVDATTIDATIKCDIDQVERLLPVTIEAPSVTAPRQRGKVEVPQIAQFRFHERFRWPASQVLLVEMGVVADPVPGEAKPLVPGLPLPLNSSAPPRADLLVLVENRGKAGPANGALGASRAFQPEPLSYPARR